MSGEDIQTARALGEFSAQIASLARSVDQLRTDAAGRDGGLQAQITEVANQQRAMLTDSAKSNERLENHLKSDEQNHSLVMDAVGKVKSGLDDLLTWRGKILGGLAVIGILIGIFGHYIAELIGGLWHTVVK